MFYGFWIQIFMSSLYMVSFKLADATEARVPCQRFDRQLAQDPTFYCFNDEEEQPPASIPWDNRCDGRADCADGSDEYSFVCGNCGPNSVPSSTCASYCPKTCEDPDGTECDDIEVLDCTCQLGYVINNEREECAPYEEVCSMLTNELRKV